MAAALSNSEFKLIGPRGLDEQSGSAATLSCHLSPELSAVGMEIRWFKETDCVCLYKNRQVTEGRGYEGRVSLITQELERGNVSLQIRDCRLSDLGYYLCQVTSGDTTEECTVEVLDTDIWANAASDTLRFWGKDAPVEAVIIQQRNRKWTEEERMKMEESALLTEKRMQGKRDEEKKTERELERELKRRTEMEEKMKKVKEEREGEGREMEERHRQKMEETDKQEARKEVERNLMKRRDLEKKHEEEAKSGGMLENQLLLAEVFIPEETEVTLEDGTTTCYRFQCPHAGQFQCKFTNLVFEMKGKGEVLYRIVSWDDRLLDGLGQMQPAGPLYDIDCKGSVSHLHLPHCEILSDESQVQQAVAHFTAGNVEIIPPLRVTNTHVIIRIQGLSLFGLLRKLFTTNPISAQVLLFHKKLSVRKRMSKLNIHLLPRNVPVEEVKKKHPSSKYIDTSSKCQLTAGRKYRPSCDPYVSQPKVEKFECDFGPNYHPTFEVFIDIDAENATIGLLDKDEQEVWEPRLVFLTDINTEGVKLQADAEWVAFVDDHREQLIQRVSSVMEILDCLENQKMISKEMYDNIKVTKPSQEQMRILYNVLHSGGRAVKVEFYKILKKKQQLLVDELEAGPSRA